MVIKNLLFKTIKYLNCSSAFSAAHSLAKSSASMAGALLLQSASGSSKKSSREKAATRVWRAAWSAHARGKEERPSCLEVGGRRRLRTQRSTLARPVSSRILHLSTKTNVQYVAKYQEFKTYNNSNSKNNNNQQQQ